MNFIDDKRCFALGVVVIGVALFVFAFGDSQVSAQRRAPRVDALQDGEGERHRGEGRDLRPMLERRVRENPDDGVSWRLLGQARMRAGDLPGAAYALRQAVRLMPESAAANFYLAQSLTQLGDRRSAQKHFRKTVELAPDSRYAKRASEHLSPDEFESAYQLASYEITRFDGSDQVPDAERLIEGATLDRPFFLFFETGLLYNTNVALAPTSRDLSGPQRESLQLFANPEMEWTLWRSDRKTDSVTSRRGGVVGSGYWNFNQRDFQSLNLQSYRGGLFVEGEWRQGYDGLVIPRIEYAFTHDEFDGVTFGNRHELTASLNSLWENGDITSIGWTIDHTDFREDGDPATETRDGVANTLVLSHSFFLDRPRLVNAGGGLTLERTNSSDDFTFNGVALFADAELRLTDCLDLLLDGSVGYRDYPDATVTPSRNEITFRGSAQLRRYITDYWSVSGVFSYDRFDSDNAQFASDRVMAGVFTTFER